MKLSLFTRHARITSEELFLAGAIFIGGIAILIFIKQLCKYLGRKIAAKHPLRKGFFEIFGNFSRYSVLIIPLFAASLVLPFAKVPDGVFAGLFIFAVMRELGRILDYILRVVMEKGFKPQDPKTKHNLIAIFRTILQIGVWIIATLVFFNTIGVALTPLLTSLGVGGVAVAFASQKLIEDFFSSFSIMSSSPFRIGDIVTIKNFTGTVKKIGLRSTSLETVEGKSIVIPNRLVVAEVIENSGTIEMRRKRFSLTITYETPVEKVRQIPKIIEEIIKKHKKTTFERAVLKEMQASNLEILISYVVESDDWLLAVKIHEQILLEILEVFAKEGIGLAYPTQTLYVKK
ncbi:mechanosensitive ion channel [Candidatus Gracilibacteria bacterium]|nr:mechanosensitive ion channel [Candidatus Gracilibacteria bacterium]